MAKNALTTKKTKNFRDITAILNNPNDRAKLQSYIDEVVRCKTKILDEQESIRGLRDSAVEELAIEPKLFSALVSLFFNNNFDQKKEEISKLEAAIEALQSNPALPE